jgi:hypothetical protein
MEPDTVTVRASQVWRGPNIAAYMPVIRVTLDIGPYEDHPSTDFPGMVDSTRRSAGGDCRRGGSGD